MHKSCTRQLTPKQKLFCHEYLRDLNATQAAIRAGYSAKSAYSIGQENLNKPEVSAYIAELKQARMQRVDINADWILKRSAELYKQCIGEKPIMHGDREAIDEHGRPIYKFSPANAARTLEIIGKHVDVRAFDNKLEVHHTITPQERKAMLEEVERRHKEERTSLTMRVPDVVNGEYEEV